MKISHNKQFLLFLYCFLLNQIIVSPFVHIFDIESEEPKIGIWGKGLNMAERKWSNTAPSWPSYTDICLQSSALDFSTVFQIVDLSKLKAIADNKVTVAHKMTYILQMVENIEVFFC